MVRPNAFLTVARRIGAGVALGILVISCQGRSPGTRSSPSRMSPIEAAVIESRASQETLSGALAKAVDGYFHSSGGASGGGIL
jgi:hypothetical protein